MNNGMLRHGAAVDAVDYFRSNIQKHCTLGKINYSKMKKGELLEEITKQFQDPYFINQALNFCHDNPLQSKKFLNKTSDYLDNIPNLKETLQDINKKYFKLGLMGLLISGITESDLTRLTN